MFSDKVLLHRKLIHKILHILALGKTFNKTVDLKFMERIYCSFKKMPLFSITASSYCNNFPLLKIENFLFYLMHPMKWNLTGFVRKGKFGLGKGSRHERNLWKYAKGNTHCQPALNLISPIQLHKAKCNFSHLPVYFQLS